MIKVLENTMLTISNQGDYLVILSNFNGNFKIDCLIESLQNVVMISTKLNNKV